MRWGVGGVQGRDKAIISANETALSKCASISSSSRPCVLVRERMCASVSERSDRGHFLASECHPPPLPHSLCAVDGGDSIIATQRPKSAPGFEKEDVSVWMETDGGECPPP